jgi:hypothetical protein
VQAGWSHWTIPQAGRYAWGFDAATGIVTTPTTTQSNPWANPVTEHASTIRSYPDGFVLDIEFTFDPSQIPIFPATGLSVHKHRPTFLGNSGVGIYNWIRPSDGASIGYLYEVQVTDVSGMTGGVRNILNKNRFLRLDYGANWTQRGEWAPLVDPDGTVTENTILNTEMTHLHPRSYELFATTVEAGGADSLCAFVAGLPVSYFKDVYLTGGGEEFPKPGTAVSSAYPLGANQPNPLPISGVEDPRDMCWGHRADYVPTDAGGYRHFNKLDSGAWNTLRVCFLPARYRANGDKCLNAYLHTAVNASESFGGGFQGEIKSGTRTSRHTNTQDPEPAVVSGQNGDLKIRLLGHWGSTVKFRNVAIRSMGSVE